MEVSIQSKGYLLYKDVFIYRLVVLPAAWNTWPFPQNRTKSEITKMPNWQCRPPLV